MKTGTFNCVEGFVVQIVAQENSVRNYSLVEILRSIYAQHSVGMQPIRHNVVAFLRNAVV